MTAKILVVDDEPDVEDLVRQRFRRQIREGSIAFGFARDGEEALAFLAENPDFDTVVYGDARQSMTYHRGNGNLLSRAEIDRLNALSPVGLFRFIHHNRAPCAETTGFPFGVEHCKSSDAARMMRG